MIDAETLARLTEAEAPVLSVYLSRPMQVNPSARLTDLLRPIREAAVESEHREEKAVRQALNSVMELSWRLETEPAPGVAIFATNGEVSYEALPGEVWDVAMLADAPYLRPLRALPEPTVTLIATTDRRRADIFMKRDGEMTPAGVVEEETGHKANYGGWKGLAEHGARNAAEEMARRHFDRVAERFFEMHKAEPVTWVAIGGHQGQVDEVAGHLHPYLRQRMLGTFVIDPTSATPHTVKEAVSALEAAARASKAQAVAEQLVAGSESGDTVAWGLDQVLAAANIAAIELLAVAGTRPEPGVVCSSCGWIGRKRSRCPVCGAATIDHPDIAAEAIERVIASGGRLVSLAEGTPVDGAGAAALLRFPLPVID